MFVPRVQIRAVDQLGEKKRSEVKGSCRCPFKVEHVFRLGEIHSEEDLYAGVRVSGAGVSDCNDGLLFPFRCSHLACKSGLYISGVRKIKESGVVSMFFIPPLNFDHVFPLSGSCLPFKFHLLPTRPLVQSSTRPRII